MSSQQLQKPQELATRTTMASHLLALSTILLAVGIWAIVTDLISPQNSPLHQFNPQDTFKSLFNLLQTTQIYSDIAVSLFRLLLGLVIACIFGITLGAFSGSIKTFEKSTFTLFQFLRMTSPVSWTPIAIVLFGIGTSPAVALIAFTSTWPIMIATAQGVKSVDLGFKEVAKNLGANKIEVIRYVTFPAITPFLITGLRTALGVGWIVLVPVEMLGSNSGLGYAISNAKDALDYSQMLAIILIIGFLGFLLDTSIRLLMKRYSTQDTY